MLKLEIRLNAEQISEGGKYTPEVLQGTLIRAFQKEQMDYSEKPDGTLLFVGRGCTNDYACFGKLIMALRNQSWFMEYVERWIWYNSDDGEDENDFVVEDVLQQRAVRVINESKIEIQFPFCIVMTQGGSRS